MSSSRVMNAVGTVDPAAAGRPVPAVPDIRGAALCLGLLLVLAACSYTPAYAPGGAGDGLFGSILVREPDTENDYIFVRRLDERLGRSNGARYRLNYSIETDTESVGRTLEQQVTRFNVSGTAQYQAVDTITSEVVHSGTVEGITGYSATIPLAGARAATRDANRRLMVILADQVAVRVLASYRDWEG